MITEAASWKEELRKGLDLSGTGQFDPALRCFERALALAPKRPETACALGRERMRRGENEAARQLLERAWRADDSLLTAGTCLARCLGLGLGKFRDGHAVLADVERRKGVQSMTRVIRAELLLEEGRHEEAALVSQPLLDSEDSAAAYSAKLMMSRVHNERGLGAAEQGSLDRALFAFKTSHDLDPGWASPLCNLGVTFETLGRPSRAETAYRQAIAVEARCTAAWQNLAWLYQRREDIRALESFERAHQSDLRDPSAAADYAAALLASGNHQAAVAVLHEHAEEWDHQSQVWAQLAGRLAKHHELDMVELCLRRAHEHSTKPDQKNLLASLLRHRERWSSALSLALADCEGMGALNEESRRTGLLQCPEREHDE